MAISTLPVQEGGNPLSYDDWAHHVGYELYELAYQAEAARALLHESDQTEADEKLTGVSYLLTRLKDECKKLSEEVSNTSRTYVLPSGGAQ